MAVNPNPRTSTPARTEAVVPREAAKRFDFIDDIWFLLLVSNKPEMVSAAAEAAGFGECESELRQSPCASGHLNVIYSSTRHKQFIPKPLTERAAESGCAGC